MSRPRSIHVVSFRLSVGLILLVVACAAPPAPSPGATSEQGGRPSAGPTRIVVAISSEIKTLYQKLNPLSAQAGVAELEEVVNAGLTNPDPQGVRWPQLAEAVPTLQNGLWKLLPDGTMETTWTIREGVRWHDGTPYTTDDLLFTLTVARDRDLRAFGDRTLDFIQEVAAKDSRTINVRWRLPVYDADALYSRSHALPIPKHLLERAYQDEKLSFTDHAYWSEAFVGTGPYQLREWARGSYAVLGAFDGYVLGRPKIDEIEVRFIASSDTLVANLLAGTVEMNIGRGLSLDQALQVRDRWRDGTVKHYPGSWMGIHPQLLTPSPLIVGNVQFREALLRGIDRQQMADELLHGLSLVSHAFMSPDDALYDRFTATIPQDERAQVFEQIVLHLAQNQVKLGLFYDPINILVHNRIENVAARRPVWNSKDWQVE